MFSIASAPSAAEDLKALRAYDRAAVAKAIWEHLSHEPTTPTRNRKLLVGVHPPFDVLRPVWQLRVGEFRVLYDVEEEERIVTVRAIRKKPPHKTTEEIL